MIRITITKTRVRKSTVITAIFFLIVLLASGQALSGTEFSGKVTKVIDGDSLVVTSKKKKIEIRLYGIDSPEYDQPYSKEAKKYVKSRLSGRRVNVEGLYHDDYGRLVSLVFVSKKSINQELVENGLAWVYKRYCRKKICKSWKKYESYARKKGLNLWADKSPVPPWQWKRRKKP